MSQKTVGIVLHTLKYNDSTWIVDIYTNDAGRIPFWIPIPKSKKARVKSLLFQPLALLEIDFEHRPKANLQKIKDAKNIYPFNTIPYHPIKSCIGLFLADFLHHALRDELTNPPLFGYIHNSIEWFDSCENEFTNFHLVFLARLSRFLGFFPQVDNYHPGYYFDLLHSEFTPQSPTHSAYINPEEAKHIPLLLRMNYETMRYFKFTGQQRSRYLEIINPYYRLHLPN